MNQQEKAVIDAAVEFVRKDGRGDTINKLNEAVAKYIHLQPQNNRHRYYAETFPNWWVLDRVTLQQMVTDKQMRASKISIEHPEWKDLIRDSLTLEQIIICKKEIENEN
ncbi:hypothetical protein Ab1vBOLIVR2_gp29 [Agrobacterium phage OLIVR2]|uniref:Uncharacterized protein n=1 Tax=Agrobacterium phage OLIVR1 TaxID=2723769 RepID=A0A858MR15_9CAUD|nr:hypothetical protein [Xanthomonas campestris]YP_010107063.1 hypothetical protein KNU98_gp080 [Agrobacterium phage OLIVR1]QIW87332.1 hypothetical protein Ab1vBOLIVR2_gp29 [Agrobacterium phage OLIVR2]QIW87439.1 hypothetical protein Ab1vBOLIVR3_gp29 [Agrobacterium phage OLIVR3]MCF8861623.1 hypothetical protein [Xanthomonas campestris pv. campestris]QIW87224.1 hypothetical protein Ab1vBOLIVR1_gp29 [Agrobacterium phage OLIVR1]